MPYINGISKHLPLGLTMKLVHILPAIVLTISTFAVGPIVRTTTGPIAGSEVTPGVLAWKGIPFAVPPTGERRWTLPVLNKWTKTKNTTRLIGYPPQKTPSTAETNTWARNSDLSLRSNFSA